MPNPQQDDASINDSSGEFSSPTRGTRQGPVVSRNELEQVEQVHGAHPGDQYVRLKLHPHFRRARAGRLVPSDDAVEPQGPIAAGFNRLKRAISREFTFMGFPVQFFQGHIMQLQPNGVVQTMNLLQEGLMPATRVNGSTFPASDPALTGTAPQVGQADYADAVVDFTRRTAPNEFSGQPVAFFDRFMGTVDLATAFPGGGGNPSLLPLLNLEIWGVPTSRPQADPSNPGFIYQRFQRSIMHYQESCRCTERILLADWFRTVITGRGLPGDLAQDMASSPFYLQYDNNQPNGVARPVQLPNTDMRFAFEPQ